MHRLVKVASGFALILALATTLPAQQPTEGGGKGKGGKGSKGGKNSTKAFGKQAKTSEKGGRGRGARGGSTSGGGGIGNISGTPLVMLTPGPGQTSRAPGGRGQMGLGGLNRTGPGSLFNRSVVPQIPDIMSRGLGRQDPPDAEPRPVVFRAGRLPRQLSWFEQLDTDQDGQVGLYEWVRAGRSPTAFKPWDRNDDGLLTAEEALAYLQLGDTADTTPIMADAPGGAQMRFGGGPNQRPPDPLQGSMPRGRGEAGADRGNGRGLGGPGGGRGARTENAGFDRPRGRGGN